jgi:ubiquinone/menaquinone biosynthesis C-methylase UbiE
VKTFEPKAMDIEEARIRDAYARRATSRRHYSCFDPGQLFIIQQLERHMLALLRHEGSVPLTGRRILEIGCGAGYWLREFIKWGAKPENLVGVDLLENRVAAAKSLCPPAVRVEQANAARLNFAAESFDLVFQATVFTSISDAALKAAVAGEMMRLVKHDGLILWYDFRFNNPRNPDVRGVEREEIARLFPGCKVELRRVTLAPPLARRLAPISWMSCQLLEKIPWLCTHYLGVIRKFKLQDSNL